MSRDQKILFRSVLLALLIGVLAFSNVGACSYKANVSAIADCDKVTVTATPEVYVESSNYEWRPVINSGTGVFFWGPSQTSMSGNVSVTWTRWHKNNGNGSWNSTGQTDTGLFPWSKNKPTNCQVNTATLTQLNNCVGYARSATFSAGGVLSGQIADTWKDPFVIEGPVPAGNVVVTWTSGTPLSITLPYAGFSEPANCQVKHVVTSGVVKDCVGWSAWYAIDGVKTTYASGTWSDPYTLESALVDEQPIPMVSGQLYDKTKIDAFSVNEERSCLKEHKYAAVITTTLNICRGWQRTVTITDDGVFVSSSIIDSGAWSKPFEVESVPAKDYLVTFPDGSSTTANAPAILEDAASCQKEHVVTSGVNQACKRGWAAWYAIDGVKTTYASGTWSDPYTLETVNVPSVDIPTVAGEVYDKTKIDAFSFKEDESCLVEKEVADFQLIISCGTDAVGSWIKAEIINPHATFAFEGQPPVHGSFSITLDNSKAPYGYINVADAGYVFEDKSTVMTGSVGKLEKCWVNPPRKDCPTCGPNKAEVKLAEGNLVSVKGSQDCVPCLKGKNYGYEVSGSFLYSRWEVAQFKVLVPVDEKVLIKAGLKIDVDYVVEYAGRHKIKQVFLLAKSFDGFDKVYWHLIAPRAWTSADGFVYYDMKGNRLDGYGHDIVDDYVACGVEYGYWFVQKDGTMLIPTLLNINSWDVENWLVSAGYFPDTVEGWAAAKKFLNPTDHAWEDMVKSGVIGQLPPKQ